MKRLLSVLIVISMLLSLSACISSNTKFENFADCKDDFETISDFLRSYFLDNACSALVLFDFQEGKILRDGVVVSDGYLEETETIQNKGFSFVWVQEEYMIFWEDETKYYGVLFSENAKIAINSVKGWYAEMQSKKLDKNWYEIGVLDSI